MKEDAEATGYEDCLTGDNCKNAAQLKSDTSVLRQSRTGTGTGTEAQKQNKTKHKPKERSPQSQGVKSLTMPRENSYKLDCREPTSSPFPYILSTHIRGETQHRNSLFTLNKPRHLQVIKKNLLMITSSLRTRMHRCQKSVKV